MFLSNQASRILRPLCTKLSTPKSSLLLQNQNVVLCIRNLSTAQLIKELRKSTGAPMVECKKAISDPEVNGDFDKATEWLRKNGSAKMSSKLAGRDASEGLVGIAMDETNNVAAIVRVSSETDFASRSPDFSDLVEIIAGETLDVTNKDSSSIVEELKAKPNVQKSLDDAIISIRENLQIASASTITASKLSSVLTGYVHGKVFNEKAAGTAAAIVELSPMEGKCTKSKDEIKDIGKKLAMHIVAARPQYMKPDDVPEDILQKEKDILLEQMADSGKPPEILEKIVNGRLGKFYEGVCLLEQGHMLEEKNPKVSKVLKGFGLDLVSYESVSIQ